MLETQNLRGYKQRNGATGKNPTEGTTVSKQGGSAKRVLNDRELDAFLAAIQEDEIWYDFSTPS